MPTSRPESASVSEATRSFLDAHGIRPNDGPILVGVSGGPDSMVLADVLARCGFDLHVVHVNYGVRGADADADESLVRAWCRERDFPFESVDGAAALRTSPGSSLQAGARRVRYRAFRRYADLHGIGLVAVGHNRDDQVETVLLNLLRRAGFDGIAGMRPVRTLGRNTDCRLIRPLLSVSRTKILDYAGSRGVPWRRDASNEDRRFLRARLRHGVIPALKKTAGANVEEDLLGVAEAMRLLFDVDLPSVLDAGLLPEPGADGRPSGEFGSRDRLDRAVTHELPLESLRRLEPAVRAWLYLRVVRSVLPGAPTRQTSVESIEGLLEAPVGKRAILGHGTVWRERTALKFERSSAPSPVSMHSRRKQVDLPGPGATAEVSGRFGRLVVDHLESAPNGTKTDPRVALVDASRICGRLTLRPWSPGDRLVPFGMKGSRKVKSVLTDARVPTSERGDVYVLCDEERIVWVVGYRMDEYFRVGAGSDQVLRFRHDRGGN